MVSYLTCKQKLLRCATDAGRRDNSSDNNGKAGASPRRARRTGPGPYLTVLEVAALLGVHSNTVYRMLHRPGFPVTRVGGVIRIPRVAFESYLAQNTTV